MENEIEQDRYLSTHSCCEPSSHFCSYRALPAAPGWQSALPACVYWGEGGQEWGHAGDVGVRASLCCRAMGSKGRRLPASRLHGLHLPLPLTGAAEVSSCLQELCYSPRKLGRAESLIPSCRDWFKSCPAPSPSADPAGHPSLGALFGGQN